jgi:monoamine oxidase
MLKKSILFLVLSLSIHTHLCAERIAILGGGLSGLTAAYELVKNDVHNAHEIVIFEGRDRLGGRVHTHYFDEGQNSFYEEGGTFIVLTKNHGACPVDVDSPLSSCYN